MDIFKQNKNLTITIVVLVILNLITVSLLWLGKPKHNAPRGAENVIDEKVHVQNLLKEELGFNEKQTQKYLQLRSEHHRQTRKLHDELNMLKREMFDKILEDETSTELSDSLLSLTLEKQSQIEKLTFNHFLSLKKICNSDQQKNLKTLMHGIFTQPPPGVRPNGPPSREMREGHPPPPPNRN